MAELVDEIGMTRESIAKAAKKFAERDMVRIRKDGRTPLYSINEDSPLVRRLEDFDNSLIESMIGAEEFAKIRTGRKEPVRKTAVHYSQSQPKVSGVASRPARYLKKKPAIARRFFYIPRNRQPQPPPCPPLTGTYSYTPHS